VLEVDPRDLVETVREGLLVLDSDSIIRFANRTVADTDRGSITHGCRSRRAVGRRLCPTARRPVEAESGNKGTVVSDVATLEASCDLRA
jgi:hypothetical protein